MRIEFATWTSIWTFQIYGICFLVLATSPINGGVRTLRCAIREFELHCKRNVPVLCAFPNVEKIAFYFGQYHWAKRKHNFYMKTACSLGKRMFIDRHGPRPLLSNGCWTPFIFYCTLPFTHNFLKTVKERENVSCIWLILLFEIFAVSTGIRSLSKFSALNLFHMFVLYFRQIFWKHF